jgi:hypothetical protein
MTPHGQDSFDRGQNPSACLAAAEGTPRFEGFDPPESNFWRLPNNWFDLVAGFTSWAEHKVVEYILRHTWGYNEYGVSKLITMDEFMHGRKRRDGSRMDAGCGMAENSIKKGIADAVSHGFLIVEVDSRDLGRIRKFYAPRMRGPVQADEGIHARPAEDRKLIPGGQGLTPDPRILTLDRQPVTRLAQELIPRPPTTDPRTGTAQHGNTYPQHSETDNMFASPALQVEQARNISRPALIDSVGEAGPQAQRRHSAPQAIRSLPSSEDAGSAPRSLEIRLIDQGITPARAASLVRRVPSEQIEQQLGWIDRRRFRDRAATLIRAIEENFAPPPMHRPTDRQSSATFDPAKFFRGAYAVCPECGARPCAADCPSLGDTRPQRSVFSS